MITIVFVVTITGRKIQRRIRLDGGNAKKCEEIGQKGCYEKVKGPHNEIKMMWTDYICCQQRTKMNNCIQYPNCEWRDPGGHCLIIKQLGNWVPSKCWELDEEQIFEEEHCIWHKPGLLGNLFQKKKAFCISQEFYSWDKSDENKYNKNIH